MKGDEYMNMYDSLLEQLAQRIEHETGDKKAAEIVRSAKSTSEDTKRTK